MTVVRWAPAAVLKPCSVHNRHSPVHLTTELHHVIPQAWQAFWTPASGPHPFAGRGPDGNDLWDARTVPLCPTGHRNVHAHLVALMRGKPIKRRALPERDVAQLAMTRWLQAGGDLDALRAADEWGYA